MAGFYNVENLGEFKVNDPFLNLQTEVRGLKAEVIYGGGVFDIEPAKQIIASNQTFFNVYAVMSGANTGSAALIGNAYDELTSSVTSNISNILSVSTLYALRDIYVNLFRAGPILATNSAYSLEILSSLNGVAYLVNGLLQNPVTVSTVFQSILTEVNSLFTAVAARDTATAEAIRLSIITTLPTKIPLAIGQLSAAYAGVTGTPFSVRAQTYFGALLNAISSGGLAANLQAIVDLSKQKY